MSPRIVAALNPSYDNNVRRYRAPSHHSCRNFNTALSVIVDSAPIRHTAVLVAGLRRKGCVKGRGEVCVW